MLAPLTLAPLPARPQPLRLWLLTGGMSSEHEISILSAATALQHFAPGRCVIRPAYIARDGAWVVAPEPMPAPFDDATIERCLAEWSGPDRRWPTVSEREALDQMRREREARRLDMVFIMMHGEQGEDGQIQSLLSDAHLPHTGSGPEASRECMDKRRTQTALREHGLPVPAFLPLGPDQWRAQRAEVVERIGREIGFPCVLKPLRGGSSVGVQFPESADELAAIAEEWFGEERGELLCEQRIVGRELTCGVVEIPTADGWRPEPMAPTEIRPLKGAFFDYHCKYTPGATEEITPAPLPPALTERVQALALETHRLMGCRGFSRTDFMLAGEALFILEINTIPGMTPTSLLPQGAEARGLDYATLLSLLTESAITNW